MLSVWAVEAVVGGRGPIALHLSSVAVWVVDALPIVLGLAMLEAPKRVEAARSGIVPPPEPPPVVPPSPPEVPQDIIATPMAPPRRASMTPEPAARVAAPAPPERRDATPPPIPRRLAPSAGIDLAEAEAIPFGHGRTVLVVDGTTEGRALAAWLGKRDHRVVHVGDAASGSLAREAEQPDLALVDGEGVGAQALIGELGRYHVPMVVLGGATLTLPRVAVRTLRPPTARRVGEAMRELALVVDEGV
jgi:hypothetical protein